MFHFSDTKAALTHADELLMSVRESLKEGGIWQTETNCSYKSVNGRNILVIANGDWLARNEPEQ